MKDNTHSVYVHKDGDNYRSLHKTFPSATAAKQYAKENNASPSQQPRPNKFTTAPESYAMRPVSPKKK